jgi:hypothetical protein
MCRIAMVFKVVYLGIHVQYVNAWDFWTYVGLTWICGDVCWWSIFFNYGDVFGRCKLLVGFIWNF